MSVLGDIADPNVEKLVKKHWPWFVAGGLLITYVGYTYLTHGSSGTAAATTTTTSASGGAVDDTAVNDATQAQIASITANAQTQIASIQASQAIQTQNIITNGTNYQTLVNASAVQTNSLAATAAQQNLGMAQALATGFGNYAISTANIATAESTTAANLGASNDAANGSNVLSSTLQGIGSIVGGLNSGGLGGMGSISVAGGNGGGNGSTASTIGSIVGLAGLLA
jgi:hypothetical protein